MEEENEMSPMDMPRPIKLYVVADAHKKAAGESDDRFFQSLLEEPKPGSSAGKNMLAIGDIGQVERMSLPATWQEGQPTPLPASAFFKEYHAGSDADVKLCFYYRGQRASQAASAAFRNLLAKPCHVLTPSEIRSVAEIMRNKDDAGEFSMIAASTQLINGRRVLVVEGRFNEKQVDTEALYADCDGTGAVVQEIYYQAPKNRYVLHLKEARDAFKSIVWK